MNEVWIVVVALSRKDLPVVEPGRVCPEMPLANESGLVSGLLEEFRKRNLRAVKAFAVASKAVDVAVLAGENTGPRGTADGIGAEGIDEESPLLREAVDAWGLVDP